MQQEIYQFGKRQFSPPCKVLLSLTPTHKKAVVSHGSHHIFYQLSKLSFSALLFHGACTPHRSDTLRFASVLCDCGCCLDLSSLFHCFSDIFLVRRLAFLKLLTLLKKLLTYAKSVYAIPQKIKGISDKRKRRSIPLFNIVMPVFVALLLQYESFHMVFSSPESMKKRLRNMIKGRKPKVDAVRDALAVIDAKEIEAIQDTVVEKIKRNRVLQGGTIDGYVTAAIDGVELFSSTKKSCFECLSRSGESDTTEYFHRSVVCATIGQSPHIIFGQEMLKPRDGAQKDEGELTGANTNLILKNNQ